MASTRAADSADVAGLPGAHQRRDPIDQRPVLLFGGDRDDLLPLDLTLELYRLLENAELAVCPNADHFGTMRPERARLLAAILGDFASRHSSTR